MPDDMTIRGASAGDSERLYLDSLIRGDYELCHPGETLADIEHRARFSKADRGLLRDWMEVARRRAAATQKAAVAADSLVQPNRPSAVAAGSTKPIQVREGHEASLADLLP
jgi:hypothetical protein